MQKVDFKKTLKHLYSASIGTFDVVEVPTMKYLMIDGHGDPNTAQEYKDALETLYPVAYKLKFMSKAQNRDYVVPPLQGLWWAENMASFVTREKDLWDWTLMLMLPDWISIAQFEDSVLALKSSKNLAAIDLLRMQELSERTCVQTMHIGSYDDEAPTLAYLHDEWLPKHGYVENGKHHEIYISDPRKTIPAKLKTILRQPVRSV